MVDVFDVVDEKDNVVGTALRKECHSNPKLIHRSIGIFVFNSIGELFLQKRSMKKDLDAGLWDLSVSGHVEKGQTYEEAAKRELMEELGVTTEIKYFFDFKYRVKQESENSRLFFAKHNGPFKLNSDEISEGRFFGLEKVKEMMKEKIISPYCLLVLKEYFERG